MDFVISQEDFNKASADNLASSLYNEAFDHYKKKNDNIAQKSLPILQDILHTRGATVNEILVPFTDGLKQIGVVVNLQKAVESKGKELVVAMEKFTVLGIIDQAWKEHLREMDDLKQSVQNAVYEQKDPLLVYKFEAFELFKAFIGKVNQETIAFLMKSDIPVQEADEVKEARRSRRAPVLRETKAESQSILNPQSQGTRQAMPQNAAPVEKVAPMKSEKVAGRNDRVSVQYTDGSVKKDVKFKTVEEDIKNSRCIIIE